MGLIWLAGLFGIQFLFDVDEAVLDYSRTHAVALIGVADVRADDQIKMANRLNAAKSLPSSDDAILSFMISSVPS
jgi:hypothetical protein